MDTATRRLAASMRREAKANAAAERAAEDAWREQGDIKEAARHAEAARSWENAVTTADTDAAAQLRVAKATEAETARLVSRGEW